MVNVFVIYYFSLFYLILPQELGVGWALQNTTNCPFAYDLLITWQHPLTKLRPAPKP